MRVGMEKEMEDEIDNMPSALDGEKEGSVENEVNVSLHFEEDEDEEYVDSDESLQND